MIAKITFPSKYQVYTAENNFPQTCFYTFLITLDLAKIILYPASMEKD